MKVYNFIFSTLSEFDDKDNDDNSNDIEFTANRLTTQLTPAAAGILSGNTIDRFLFSDFVCGMQIAVSHINTC